MNCKPGDLAVYVGYQPQFWGHIKTVVRFVGYHPWDGKPGWWVEPPFVGGHGHQNIVYDESLRPIRDPGDDARDETLEWLPVPSRETEAA